jgi:hypothetical protein
MTPETISSYLADKDFRTARYTLSNLNAVDVARLLRVLPDGQESWLSGY